MDLFRHLSENNIRGPQSDLHQVSALSRPTSVGNSHREMREWLSSTVYFPENWQRAQLNRAGLFAFW
jgi:hypothetical protein